MYYRKYLKLKSLKESLHHTLEKKKEKENATVTIRDLVVYPVEICFSRGEAKSHDNKYSDMDAVKRLIDHTQLLADIANSHHQNAYCRMTKDGTFQLKKKYLNHITRISLNEFSLYSDKPCKAGEKSRPILQKIKM